MLDPFTLPLRRCLLSDFPEKPSKILRLSLQDEKELLIVLQFPPRVFVQSFEIERVFRRDVGVVQEAAKMAPEMFLVFDHLIQGNFVFTSSAILMSSCVIY